MNKFWLVNFLELEGSVNTQEVSIWIPIIKITSQDKLLFLMQIFLFKKKIFVLCFHEIISSYICGLMFAVNLDVVPGSLGSDHHIPRCQGHLLLTWFNFNPSMDK